MDRQVSIAPIDSVMPHTANLLVAALNFFVLAVVFIPMARDGRRIGSTLPLFCMLGAALAFPMEAIYDIVGAVWYPALGQEPVLIVFNISIPLWIPPAYPRYIGGQGYFMFKKFEAGITAPKSGVITDCSG